MAYPTRARLAAALATATRDPALDAAAAKVADRDVTAGKVAGDVTAGKVAGDVTAGKVAGDVTASKVAGDVTASKVAGDATASKVAGDVMASKVAGNPTAETEQGATAIPVPARLDATQVATDVLAIDAAATPTDRTLGVARTATWAVAGFIRDMGGFGDTSAPQPATTYETVQQPAFTGLRMLGAISTGMGLVTLGALLLSLASARANHARRRRIF